MSKSFRDQWKISRTPDNSVAREMGMENPEFEEKSYKAAEAGILAVCDRPDIVLNAISTVNILAAMAMQHEAGNYQSANKLFVRAIQLAAETLADTESHLKEVGIKLERINLETGKRFYS